MISDFNYYLLVDLCTVCNNGKGQESIILVKLARFVGEKDDHCELITVVKGQH